MSVSSSLFVDRATQIQHFDDTSRAKIKILTDHFYKLCIRKLSCAKCFYMNRCRMCNTDCIRKLDLTLVGQSCCHNILSYITSCISCRTVYLCTVLSGKSTAAVTSCSTVCIYNELTFYSKIDTNRIPYTFSKLNVEDYFSDCAEEVGLELETKGIELVYANYVENDVVVIADGEQIRRVIHNIIGNAIKYMDKKRGIIQIRVKDVGDFIQVEIEDNGKGIGAKDLPYIFDRFYRTDISRNSSKGGSGIGLSIVKKILEDHGGKVWATSREGIGTIMYFVLRKYQEVPMK